jgi:hypothetical protein
VDWLQCADDAEQGGHDKSTILFPGMINLAITPKTNPTLTMPMSPNIDCHP